MGLSMAGIDYNRAGVDIRSRFAFGRAEMNEAFAKLQRMDHITGSVILSTCNRTELWISTDGPVDMGGAEDPLVKQLLCSLKGLSPEDHRQYLFALHEDEAVDHIFRLASGLESRILGEDQIISQVKDALGKSRENFAADHVMEVLFRQAVTAGKRVKTEVNLSTADRSVIHQAISLLRRQGYDLQGKQTMVIGNGMMGKLAAGALRDAGADVTVTVRQYHNGAVEVPAGCGKIDYEDRYAFITEKACDLVVSATSSPNLTVQAERLREILPLGRAAGTGESAEHGQKEELLLIDLAVPRDIDPACGELQGCRLYDIDSFETLPDNAQLRDNVSRAERILEEEKEEFFDYYEGRDLLPMISSIKELAAEDLNARLKQEYKKISAQPELQAELTDAVEGAAQRMMNKLLFSMKDGMDGAAYRDCLKAMRDVFTKDR